MFSFTEKIFHRKKRRHLFLKVFSWKIKKKCPLIFVCESISQLIAICCLKTTDYEKIIIIVVLFDIT